MSGKNYVTIEGKRYSKADIQRNCSAIVSKNIDQVCKPGVSIRFVERDGTPYSHTVYSCSRVKADGKWFVTLFNGAGNVWSDAVPSSISGKITCTWCELINEKDVHDIDFVVKK